MIYLMVENISGSVIRSQVLSALIEITQHFDLEVDLLAMERRAVWEQTDNLNALRRELDVHRVSLHVFVHYGKCHPMTYINLTSMLLKLLGLLIGSGHQVIVARNFHAAFLAIPLRMLFPRSHLTLDLRGVFVQELVLKGLVRENRILHRVLKWMERQSYAFADHILCVSNRLARSVVETLGREKEMSVIPCCVDPAFFALDAARSEVIEKQLGLTGKFVVLYAGSLNSWNLLEPMLDLFEIVRKVQPGAHFLFLTLATDQARRAFLERAWPSDDYTVTAVPHQDIKDYLTLGDLGMLLREDNLVNRVASPVKLGEYLACGVPVCMTPHVGDLSDLVSEHKVGLVVTLNDESLDEALASFVQDIRYRRESYRKRCRELSRAYFSREAYYPAYGGLLERNS